MSKESHRGRVWGVAVAAAVLVAAGALVWFMSRRPSAPEAAPAAPAVPERQPGIHAGTHALWVWENEAVTNALARTELFAVCRAYRVTTLFFAMGQFADVQYNRAYLDQLKTFLDRAHGEGLRVHALRPLPTAAEMIRRERQYEAVTYLRDFLKFNRALAPGERFDGLLLDAQPQRLPEWAEGDEDIQQAFVDFVTEVWKTVVEFDEGLSLGWTLPASFTRYAWLPRVLERLDYVVLVGAPDRVEAIADYAAAMLEAGAATDTRVVIGLELRDLEGQGEGWAENTLHEEGPRALRETIEGLGSVLAGEAAYAGVAIRDYKSLAAWGAEEPGGGKPAP